MATFTIGQSASAFSLRGTDGKIYTLDQNDARLTLAVFFKTTCPTCALAFPYIEKMHRAYGDAGLAVWGISQHDRAESAKFAVQSGATFPILIDEAWRASQQYDPQFVPTQFLIDPSRQIIDLVVSFDKGGLNRIAQKVARRLNVDAVLIAPENDGNPPFRPG
jgi:peroxiredoxin